MRVGAPRGETAPDGLQVLREVASLRAGSYIWQIKLTHLHQRYSSLLYSRGGASYKQPKPGLSAGSADAHDSSPAVQHGAEEVAHIAVDG